MERTSKALVAISVANMLLYAVQGARLAVEAGFTPLVLSNLLFTALFAVALALSLINKRPEIIAAYTSVVAAFVTYRMWGPATDAARSIEFRLGHGFTIALAWLLFSASLPRMFRRNK
jgi:hypothetical protein